MVEIILAIAAIVFAILALIFAIRASRAADRATKHAERAGRFFDNLESQVTLMETDNGGYSRSTDPPIVVGGKVSLVDHSGRVKYEGKF